MSTCERNTADPEEDGPGLGQIKYRPCGKPAAWTLEGSARGEWYACEEHAREAMMAGCEAEEHRRAEGDDDLAEERAEAHARWAEGPR